MLVLSFPSTAGIIFSHAGIIFSHAGIIFSHAGIIFSNADRSEFSNAANDLRATTDTKFDAVIILLSWYYLKFCNANNLSNLH